MTRQGGWTATGFGAILRSRRTAAGLSQAQLAERVGCHPVTVSELERGTQEPAWPLVLACAAALGIEVGAFVPPTHSPLSTPAPKDTSPPKKRGRPRKEK